MKNLLIIGAGQYGMVAKEIAESMKCFEKIDFVDDVYPSAVGKICDINKLIHEYDSAVVAIGNTELRLNLIKGLCIDCTTQTKILTNLIENTRKLGIPLYMARDKMSDDQLNIIEIRQVDTIYDI